MKSFKMIFILLISPNYCDHSSGNGPPNSNRVLSFGSSSLVGRTTVGPLQCLGTALAPCSCQVKSWKASLLGKIYSFFVSSVPYGGKRHNQGVRWLSGSRRLPSSLGPLEFSYLVPAWGKERTDSRKLSSDHHMCWDMHTPFLSGKTKSVVIISEIVAVVASRMRFPSWKPDIWPFLACGVSLGDVRSKAFVCPLILRLP